MKRVRNLISSLRRTPRKISFLIGGLSIGVLLTAGLNLKNDPYFEINKNLEIFASAYKKLNLYYVDDTEPGELMKEGIDAMLESLDPYTTFIPEAKMEDHRFMTTGQYGGIGASVQKRGDFTMITEPYEGFPAQKAGLLAGDRIIEVDGRSVKDRSVSEVSEILKGQAGTTLKVTVERMGHEEPLTFELERERVQVPPVPYHGMLENGTGYIKLNSFTRECTKKVQDAFEDLEEEGMEELVLDLRGNGGGLLKEAVKMVNLFVPKGETVVETRGRTKEWNKTYKALEEPMDTNIRVVVLVDRNSASASEIVSGCLQDLDRGVVIGRRTLGKGLVQQTQDLSYNSKIKLTVAKYYIPSGRCIQEVDYSQEDRTGHSRNVPDSLVETYQTANGREVLDARGIHPDVKVKQRKMNAFLQTLVGEHYIFDHATRFRLNVDSIPPPGSFSLPDTTLEALKEKLRRAELSYRTRTEEKLNELKEVAEEEKYFDEAQDEYEALKKELHPDKERDIQRFSDEMEELLQTELLSRYYFQEGKIRGGLQKDPVIDTALAVIDGDRYSRILSPEAN